MPRSPKTDCKHNNTHCDTVYIYEKYTCALNRTPWKQLWGGGGSLQSNNLMIG